MFVDSVEIFIASGHGGAGAVSFRREKFVIQGGPDGGDGGKGGDVYFVVDKNTATLAHFRGHKKYQAGHGAQGQSKNCNGRKGKDIFIKVPPGTQVVNAQTHEILLDLVHDNERVKLLVGGRGGLGNTHFKNSINQHPTYAQKGLAGQELVVRLELKLIADIALVGFPNAGKSSLISLLTNSHPRIANYEFTTLVPNLGVVDIDSYHSFVMADIPGLIEGASSGKGLGLQFLQHIERTKILLFMLDVSRYMQDSEEIENSQGQRDKNLLEQFDILYQELKAYSPMLATQPYAIALTKSDQVLCEKFGVFNFQDFNSKLFETKIFLSSKLYHFMQDGITSSQDSILNNVQEPLFICPISSITHLNVQALKNLLFWSLESMK